MTRKELKAKHPDCLIIERNRDFYALHDEDARTAAGCLSLPIDEDGTLRFPFSKLDPILPNLIRAGHRVAICEETEPPFEFTEDPNNYGVLTWKNDKTLKYYKALCKERDMVDMKKYDCFFAFTNEGFARGLKSIRPLREGEKLSALGYGCYGTKDGAKRLFKFYDEINDRIKKMCDPQEVYVYEYNNHECCIASDGDAPAIRLIAEIWGKETACKMLRKNAYSSVEQLFGGAE